MTAKAVARDRGNSAIKIPSGTNRITFKLVVPSVR